MTAPKEETNELISQLPDKVKTKIWSILSQASKECRNSPHVRSGRISSDPIEKSIGDILRRQGGLFIRDTFIAEEGYKAARHDAEEILAQRNMPAGMGGRNDVQVNSSYRGDRMCWLQPTHSSPALWAASEQILSLQKDLATWGYDVGGRPSIQLSMYPGNGSRYERHTDASDSVPGRTVTAILYLNPGWDAALHGGQLCIYNLADRWRPGLKLDPQMSPGYAAGEPAVVVAPIGGRLVVFESNTAHEVLPAQVPRYALTVWFTKVKSSIAVPRALPDVDQLGSRIFVSMAAFRDPETRWTVNDLLTKAIYPARLRIGIVWQIDAAADTSFMDMPHSVDQNQIRQIVIPATEATGPCKARMLAQKLWAGEEFYLQIDSHMRFVPGWDDQLVQWLAACEQQAQFGKAVLSTYPPSYEGSGLQASVPADDRPVLLRASQFGQDGMLRLVGSRLAERAAGPMPSLFWAAGFSFSRAQLIQEVPYEDLPFLFFGEEQYVLARIFTHGYDLFSPPCSVAYHLYSRAHRETFQSSVPLDATARESSQKKVLRIFEEEHSSEGPSDIGTRCSDSQGSLRSVSDLQAVCGVQYSQHILNETAMRGTTNDEIVFAADKQIHP
ncbi:hypothetical protein WJX75_009844 [Coccomyxa subellipsoidea]|uniref:procollagen-lysine 5-dioxygenase n=1 Tax=Coccomyxa subellipsoidea TaxID=248742 RepID=A0ABR2YXY7_9CHLO